MKEKWKKITFFKNDYYVSNKGRIKGTKILKPSFARRGYEKITLSGGTTKRKSITIHRLVAETFIGPRPKGFHINHKNANKSDNSVENLEYIHPKEHQKRTSKMGLMLHGEKHHKAKLSEKEAKEILSLGWNNSKKGISLKKISEMYGISVASAWSLLKRKSWKHISTIPQ